VRLYDVGEVDGVPYLTMELIEGRTLRARVDETDVRVAQKLRWMLDVARARLEPPMWAASSIVASDRRT
jgi:serine/threonine-protein kinase